MVGWDDFLGGGGFGGWDGVVGLGVLEEGDRGGGVGRVFLLRGGEVGRDMKSV